MTLQKKDFIEIEFTGKTKEGEIFDSNTKKNLEGANLQEQAKPLVFCLGEGMFLKGVDDFLIGKEIGEHKIELPSEKAFGKRSSQLIKMIPLKIFKQHQVNPIPGSMFNFDGRIAKILTVSGGRIIVDFNNPLAGKDVVYQINVLRKIDDIKEKAKSLIDFFTRKDFKFEIKEKKITITADKQFAQFLILFKDKFKEVLDLDLDVKEVEEKKEEEKKEDSPKN